MPTLDLLDFTPDDLTRALLGETEDGDLPDDDDDLGPSDELLAVARRIAGNHVEVVASYVHLALEGNPTAADHQQFAAALRSLARLAEAAGDVHQHQLLVDMRARAEAMAASSRRRGRFKRELRAWVEQFATCLEGSDAERLHRLVTSQPEALPLLAELATIRGIGPKRLERLYACGLHSVETAARADPEEVAAVTGLPGTLAWDVVDAARAFALRRRELCVARIQARLLELQRMADALDEPLPPWMLDDLSASLDGLRALVDTHLEKR